MVQQPAEVAEPEALVGRVGIQGRVGVQVMVPVRGDPLDGVALDGQNTAVGNKVLQPLWGLKAAVAELAMVGQRDAKAACHNVASHKQGEHVPREGHRRKEAERVLRPQNPHKDPVRHVPDGGVPPLALWQGVDVGAWDGLGSQLRRLSLRAGLLNGRVHRERQVRENLLVLLGVAHVLLYLVNLLRLRGHLQVAAHQTALYSRRGRRLRLGFRHRRHVRALLPVEVALS
mmetsp:Transcript_14965/g.38029  ORF Transcript_14965/g.38029 Transcript_14965/m.38029 type:complete len:230 (-) Transcript_14965:253-942(-)